MNAASEETKAPAWASCWLVSADLYNVLWDALTIGFPHLLFDLARNHHHRSLDDGGGGTILRDEVEYQATLCLIGNVLGGWPISWKLEQAFPFRRETTRRLVEPRECTVTGFGASIV